MRYCHGKTRHYQHLSPEDRAGIVVSLSYGLSMRETSRMLRRAPSIVSRELRHLPDQPYNATLAAADDHQRCHLRTKLQAHPKLHRYVRDCLLYRYWSPQQIAARLQNMPPSSLPNQQRVSHGTIYAQPRGSLKKEMIQAPCQHKSERGRRRTTLASRRSFVPEERASSTVRPAEIEASRAPTTALPVGVLSKRKTRFVILCRMDGYTAEDALEGIVRQTKHLPAFLRSSLPTIGEARWPASSNSAISRT